MNRANWLVDASEVNGKCHTANQSAGHNVNSNDADEVRDIQQPVASAKVERLTVIEALHIELLPLESVWIQVLAIQQFHRLLD